MPGAIQNIHRKFTAADLFVYPFLYESFSNVLCEAMSLGLPVIASNCIDERLFPVGDVTRLTTLVEGLVNDPGAQKRRGKTAQSISNFHPDHIFSGVIGRCRAITSRQSPEICAAA